MTEIQIQDNSSLHRYRTELPNIIFDIGLKPLALALYCLLKRIAGDNGGCFYSNKNLAKKIGCTDRHIKDLKKELAKPRVELDGLSLITIESRFLDEKKKQRTTDLVVINDIWNINFQKMFSGELSSPPLGNSVPIKKDNDKNNDNDIIEMQNKNLKAAQASQIISSVEEKDNAAHTSSSKEEKSKKKQMSEGKKPINGVQAPKPCSEYKDTAQTDLVEFMSVYGVLMAVLIQDVRAYLEKHLDNPINEEVLLRALQRLKTYGKPISNIYEFMKTNYIKNQNFVGFEKKKKKKSATMKPSNQERNEILERYNEIRSNKNV